MSTPLNVLLVEDLQADADLMVAELHRGGFDPEWKRVETEADFLAQMKNLPDIILCDYSLPQFNGMRAIKLLLESGLDIPLILISGAVGEDVAVEAMKHGATDYLLKDRMARLGNAVRGALGQQRLRIQQQRVESELRRTHETLHQMLTHSPAVIYTLKIEGPRLIPVLVSENMERLLGFTAADYARDGWWLEGLHPEDRDRAAAASASGIAAGGCCMEYRIRHKDGTYRWIEDSNRVVRGAQGEPGEIVGVWTDIGDRKRVENVLRESEEKFRQLAENINEVFWITNPAKHQMLYISPAYERIWGRTCDSLYQSPRTWLDAIHPGDRQRILEAATTKQERGDYDETYRIVRPDGAVRWIHDKGFPVRNATGEVYRIVGTAEDITGLKHSEAALEKAHRELVAASRQAGMAEMATGVLHNVGNVLNSVNIASSCVADSLKKSKAGSLSKVVALLREHENDLGVFLTSDPKGRQVTPFLAQLAEHLTAEQAVALKELAELQKNIEHIKEVVTAQQNCAKGLGTTETLQVADLVEDSLRMVLGGQRQHDIQITKEFERMPAITTDKHQVLQILTNLVRNARQACDEAGGLEKRLILRVANGDDRVRISVGDNGVGIPPESLSRIFVHGFTTKKSGHGFGLRSAMAAAKEIGGSLSVQSDGPGKGATFTLELPM